MNRAHEGTLTSPSTPRLFSKRSIISLDENWEDVHVMNGALLGLAKRRLDEITVSGIFARSKTSWKHAVFGQAMLYRIVMLGSGCAGSWCDGHLLSAILSARALSETVALLCDFQRDAAAMVASKNRAGLDRLANDLMFATRLDTWRLDDVAEARSVLSSIDRLDKLLAGTRDHYNFLSEMCHPNGPGHLLFFGDMNTSTGTVKFGEQLRRVKGMLSSVLASFQLLRLAEVRFDELDALLPTIADLQAQTNSG